MSEERRQNTGEAEQHIDRKIGLTYAGDDEAFYQQLIEIYVRQASEKILLLEKAYAAGDLRAYTVQVHGIKSNAKMIGAMKLADLAFELEKAGKEGKLELIRENQRPFMKEFVKVLEETKKISGQK